MKNLYTKLDEYALQEDIIEKSYAQHISLTNTQTNIETKTPYSYKQIKYLWNISSQNYKEIL